METLERRFLGSVKYQDGTQEQNMTIIGTKEAMKDKNIAKIKKESSILFTEYAEILHLEQRFHNAQNSSFLLEAQNKAREKGENAWKNVMNCCNETKITIVYPFMCPANWRFVKKDSVEKFA